MTSTLIAHRWRTLQRAAQDLPLGGPLLCLLWSLAWLLPNHAMPWAAFHSDAWIAAGLCAALIWVAWQVKGAWAVTRTALLLMTISLVPWLYFGAGLVGLRGDAAMSSAFLLGFALAFSLGENWTRHSGATAVSFVLAAAGMAAYASVGFQLYQWLGLTNFDGATDIWVLYAGGRGRPDANLGQPNQLATLQLWALVAIAWALYRKAIGRWGVVLGALPILLGIALTQSRTAMVTLSLWMLLAILLGRKRLFSRSWLLGASALYATFWAFVALVGPLSRTFALETTTTLSDRLDVGLRLPAWRMFIDAVGERPWLGYGWDQTRRAMFEVFPRHLELTGLPFSHSHNLFLDLVLWVGLPLGGLLSLGLVIWMAQRFWAIRSPEHAFVFGALLAMGVHAMLELPLHYAYFLLPTGVLAGALNHMQHAGRRYWPVHKVLVLGLALAMSFLLAVIVRDYLRVEQSHLELRLEKQGVGTNHNRNPPDTLLLDQWRGVIELSRLTPHGGMSDLEVDRWRDLAIYHSSAVNLQNMLSVLSLNGRHAEAEFWSQRMCAVFDQASCDWIVKRWRESHGVKPNTQSP